MKNMKIIKRDGRTQDYSWDKVKTVVCKAFGSVGQEVPDKFLEQLKQSVENTIKNKESFAVEDMQDIIQKELIKRNKYDVVESFILYRNKRNEIREQKSDLIKSVTKKLNGTNIENQNANVDEASFGGRIGEATRIVTKNDALKYRMSKKSRKNHENNEIYIHDLDSYSSGMHNCLSIPFDDLLSKGFKLKQTDVRPAGSVNTAFQLVAVIFQLQSLQQFGGVAATHLDWTMVPYVRKSFWKHYKDGLKYITGIEEKIVIDGDPKNISIDDISYTCEPDVYRYALDMTKKEIYQAVEGLYHNLNTLQSRSGNQLPFTSINYGTCTLPEGRLVIEALLNVSIEGLGTTGKTSIFPCGIFQYMKGVNDRPGTPNYDLYRLALKSTSQRLYPNYCNVDWSKNDGYDINDPRTYMSTMGCRTANLWDINGLGQLKDGRGNICPVTIILPTLAMQVKDEKNPVYAFLKLLDKKIHEAKDMLIERFNHICSQSPKSAQFMWENNVMAGYIPEDGIRSALRHGTLAIGQLGLAETLQILIGTDHTTPEGMNVAKDIEELFATRCSEFKEEYKLNFGVYYTPAENLCYTAMNKFKEKYGIIPNVSDREYFTNSMHVPVWHDVDPFKKIDIESQLTGYSSAGCITYVELPSTTMNNLEALETIVNYAMDKDIPYFAVNVPVDQCECGYTGEIGDTCPKCGSDKIERLRRVTGYLSCDYRNFNKGKQVEVEEREKHIKN
jgi:ribonucleoside-triphosphate reductase